MASVRPLSLQRNQGTSLLSPEENAEIFSLLREGCQSVSASIVKMYTTVNTIGETWHHFGTGVLLLVRDKTLKSYYLQLLCPERRKILWEHELYRRMRFCDSRPYFYTFEGEKYIVGFDFASVEEAKLLEEAVHCKLEALEIAARKAEQSLQAEKVSEARKGSTISLPSSRKAERSQSTDKGSKGRKASAASTLSVRESPRESPKHETGKERRRRLLFQKKKQSEKKTLEISYPTDFRHLTHVQSTDSILDLKRVLAGDITPQPAKDSTAQPAKDSTAQPAKDAPSKPARLSLPPPEDPPPPKPGSRYSDPFEGTHLPPNVPPVPRQSQLWSSKPNATAKRDNFSPPAPPPPPKPESSTPPGSPEYMDPVVLSQGQSTPSQERSPSFPRLDPPVALDPRTALLEDIKRGAATLKPTRKKVSFKGIKNNTYSGRHRPSILRKSVDRADGMESIFHEAIKKIGRATQGSESEASASDDEWET